MRAEIQKGVDQGEFEVDDAAGLTLAALSLAIDVCRWFSPSGRLTAERLAESYAGLVVRMVRSAAPADSVR